MDARHVDGEATNGHWCKFDLADPDERRAPRAPFVSLDAKLLGQCGSFGTGKYLSFVRLQSPPCPHLHYRHCQKIVLHRCAVDKEGVVRGRVVAADLDVFPARVGGCAPRATPGAWPRRRRT